MRAIRIADKWAEVPDSVVIEFTLRSSFFELDSLKGSFTSTFTLPYRRSARNQLIFQFAGNPRRVGRGAFRATFEFWWRGALRYMGTLEATLVGDSVECAATVELGALTEAAKAKKLTELDLGTFDFSTPQAYYPPDTHEVCVPYIQNRGQWHKFMNFYVWQWEPGPGGFPQDPVEPGMYVVPDTYRAYYTTVAGLSAIPIAPCWYWAALVRRVLEAIGYNVGTVDIPADEILINWRDTVQKGDTDEEMWLDTFPRNTFVPHITVAELLIATQVWFNVHTYVVGNTVHLRSRNGVTDATAARRPITLSGIELTLARDEVGYAFAADTTDRVYQSEGAEWDGMTFPAWNALSGKTIVDYPAEIVEGAELDTVPGDEILRDPLGRYWSKTEGSGYTIVGKPYNTSGGLVGWQSWAEQPITCPVSPIGYITPQSYVNQSAKDPTGTHPRYASTHFTALRVAKVYDNGHQHAAAGENTGLGWSLFDYSTGSEWQQRWVEFLDYYANQRETIEADLAEDEPEHFINTLDFGVQYQTPDGTRLLLDEVVVAYGPQRIGSVKVKASTLP